MCSLLSGGADSSLAIWDLEAAVPNEDDKIVHRPAEYVAKFAIHNFNGITLV